MDNRTADGAVVWVMSARGNRQLFDVTDGYELAAPDTWTGARSGTGTHGTARLG